MSQIIIDVGTVPDDGTGDPLRNAFIAVNDNFTQVFTAGPVGSNVRIANNTITTTVINSNLVLSPSGIGVVQTNNHLLPRIDDVYDLGSPTLRFNTLYLGTGGFDSVGNITANYFIGNGSQLTGVVATAGPNIVFGNTKVDIPSPGGPVLFQVANTANVLVIQSTAANFSVPVISTANVTASFFLGNGSQLTGINASNIVGAYGNANVADFLANYGSNIVVTTGNITSGNITTGNIISGNLNTAYVIASSNIVSSANISANYLIGNGSQISGVNAVTVDGYDTSISAVPNTVVVRNGTADIFANNISGTLSTAAQPNITSIGNLISLTVTGNATANNFIGNVYGGNINANYYIGNGSQLTDITAANVIGQVSNALIAGTVYSNAQPNISSVGTLTSLSVTGNVTANTFIGNVSGNISGNIVAPGGNTQVLFNDAGTVAANSNFTFNKVTATLTATAINVNAGNVTAGYLRTPASFDLVLEPSTANSQSYGNFIPVLGNTYSLGNTQNIWQNIYANIILANVLTATGNVTGGNLNTAGLVLATGNVSGGNLITAGLASVTGNVTGGNLITTGLASVTGNVTGGNLITAGLISATGNITGGNLITAGELSASSLSVTGNAVVAGNLTVNGNVTYINVEDLNVEDPIIGLGRGANNAPLTTNDGKDRGEQLWYYSGSEKSAFIGYDNSAGNLLLAKDVTIANEIVTVNNFGNITFGNASAEYLTASANITGGNLVTGGLISATGNITGGNLTTAGLISATGNITGGNLTTGGLISATGNITGGNITTTGTANIGTLAVTGAATVTGNVTGGNLITSGLISATGNITSSANISGNFVSPGANRQMLFNDNGLIGSSTLITFDKAGPTLTLTNAAGTIITGYVSSLGGTDLSLTPGTSIVVSWANINPRFSNTYALGTSSAQWRNFWAGNANIGTLGVTSNVTAGNLTTAGIGNIGTLEVTGNATVTGNISGGNISTTGTFSVTGNLSAGNLSATNLSLSGNVLNNLNVSGNVTANAVKTVNNIDVGTNIDAGGYAQITGNITGGNLITGGLISATGNITGGNLSATNLTLNGNVLTNLNVSGNVTANAIKSVNNVEIGTNIDAGGYAQITGNISGGNISTTGLISATGNITGGNLSATNLSLSGNVLNNLNVSGNVTANAIKSVNNVEVGTNIDAGGYAQITGNITGGNILTTGLISATGNITGGNLSATNLSLSGNVLTNLNVSGNVTANAVKTVNNIDVGTNIDAGGYAQITGNITGGNISTTGLISATGNITGGNLSATNLSLSGNVLNNLNVSGNVTANAVKTVNNLDVGTNIDAGGYAQITGNITGGNVESLGLISATGNITATGNLAGGNITTTGLISASGNITASGNLSGANILTAGLISATGNVSGGNVTTAGLISATGNVSGGNITTVGQVSATANITGGNIISLGNVVTDVISGSGLTIYSSANILFNPVGNHINMGGAEVINVGYPNSGSDAATKQYVDDAVSSGINIHNPVYLETPDTAGSLVATYAQGGNVYTVSQTIAGNTVVFSTAANLQVNDQLWFSSAFEGILANTAYFVVSAPNTSAAVLSTAYNGDPVANITSNASVSQSVRVNSGVGATLTANANGQLTVDGINPTTNQRILVYNQTNGFENGVYVVTDTGNVSAPWILTRATDSDTYVPDSNTGLDRGCYFFVQAGNTGAGESYVLTSPTGTLVIGYSNLVFTQFSASQVYSANTSAGLSLSGTIFSAKVDNITTAFDGNGNIIVKSSALLTTPNIGAATGTTLNTTGNITAPNFIGNIVGNITGNVSVTGPNTGVLFNDDALANATSGFTFDKNTNAVSISGNVSGGNLSTTGLISATGNVTGGNLITAGLVSATGNITALGNVTGGNLTTAGLISATGNVTGGNLNTGGMISATGNVTGGNITTGGLISATGNVTGGNITTAGLVSATGNITATGNVTGGNITTGGLISATGNVTGGNITTAGLVSATGNITATGNVAGNFILGNGAFLTGVITSVANINNGTSNIRIDTSGGNILANVGGTANVLILTSTGANIDGYVTATGNITAGNFVTNGDITGANVISSTTMTATANITGGNLNTGGLVLATGNVTGGNINTAGLVSATGNVTGGNINTGGLVSATGNITGGNLVTGGLVSATGNVTGGNINTGGLVTATANITGGNLVTGGLVSATGNVTGGNITTAGLVSAQGNVVSTAGYFVGDGGYLANVPSTLNISLIDSGNNITNAVSNVQFLRFDANSGFNLETLSTGNVKISLASTFKTWVIANSGPGQANLVASGEDVVQFVEGSGIAFLSNNTPSGGAYKTLTISTDLSNLTGNITTTGNISGNYILGNGALLTGVITSVANINNGTSNVRIDASGGNVAANVGGTANVLVLATTGAYINGLLDVTGNIAGGNLTTAGLASVTGNVIGGNLITGGLISATGNVTGGNLITAGLASVTGNVTGGNLITAGLASVTGNVTGGNLITAGLISATGNITGGNITTAGTGNIGTLSVTGDATVTGNLTVNGNVVYVNVESLNVEDPIIGLGRGPNNTPLSSNDGKDRGEQLWYYSGSEKSAFIGYDDSAGKLIAATDVSISGEVVSVNNYGNFVVGALESTTVVSSGNVTGGNVITGGLISATGNITSNANIAATYFIGNGSQLTGITGGVGTGNAFANIIVMGNVTGVSTANATLTASTTAGNLLPQAGNGIVMQANATTNIITISVIGSLNDGSFWAANSDAGAVNVVATPPNTDNGLITAPVTSQYDLGTFNSGLASQIVNDATTVNIASANSNVTIDVAGTSNVAVVTTGGANITGNLDVTGNVSASYFLGNGSQLSGINASNIVGAYSNANVANYLPTYSGNLVSLAGNVTTSANITANYFVGNGSQLTGISAGISTGKAIAMAIVFGG